MYDVIGSQPSSAAPPAQQPPAPTAFAAAA
jgi:hypothetical protein